MYEQWPWCFQLEIPLKIPGAYDVRVNKDALFLTEKNVVLLIFYFDT
jgi:hypothetical protein